MAAESRAQELAHIDPLTRLANRRRFEQALKATCAEPPGEDGVHAVLMLDLNGFKGVNDVYGHSAGDEVLGIVARRFAAAMREGDSLARLGGDEFAVIACHLAGPEAANGIALRMIKCLEAPIELSATHHRVGVGIGIALLPRDGDESQEILRKADIALYRAKAEKRSTACFFERQMDRQSREHAVLERELRIAIEKGLIRPWYQPLVDLRTEEIVGFEALARWTHPELGSIPPERFIPIAEECGQMHALSELLLRQACAAARSWPESVSLSFNISPSQLRDRTLATRLLQILREVAFSPRRLEVEITESALMRDLDVAKEVLSSLRDAGVRIALDDFGTGYSGLYYLRNFKFDKIKIDRSFVGSLGSETEAVAIVGALAGLGHGLGLTITAEGIEHQEQSQFLAQQGCQQGQGYLFSHAVPASETRRLLEGVHAFAEQSLAS